MNIYMENIFINALFISIIYFGLKIVEMKFVEKTQKPLKKILKDAIVVYFSIVIFYFIGEQVLPLTQSAPTIHTPTSTTPVFTDNPEF